jgi:hypothetical protein
MASVALVEYFFRNFLLWSITPSTSSNFIKCIKLEKIKRFVGPLVGRGPWACGPNVIPFVGSGLWAVGLDVMPFVGCGLLAVDSRQW